MWTGVPGYFDAPKFKVKVTFGGQIQILCSLNVLGNPWFMDTFLVILAVAQGYFYCGYSGF